MFREMSKGKILGVGITLLTGAFYVAPARAAVIFGDVADRELNEDNTFQAATGATMRAGASSSAPAGGRNALVVFQLPDLGAVADPFQSADLGLNLASVSGSTPFNSDVYGLGLQSTATLVIGSGVLSTTRFYEGNAVDPNSTLIQQDFTTPATNSAGFKNTNATGDTNLVAYLNSLYNNGAGADQFVVLRVNPDVDSGTGTIAGYNYSTADVGNAGATTVGAGTNFDPVITYTAVSVPEPGALALIGIALAPFLRRRRHNR